MIRQYEKTHNRQIEDMSVDDMTDREKCQCVFLHSDVSCPIQRMERVIIRHYIKNSNQHLA